jgi:aromatic ring-opening dioxygenase LigB subunit
MIKFASISTHPPLLLPGVGSQEEKKQVKKTLESLKDLGEDFKKASPDQIVISSPHPDWGFNVPLHFIAPSFQGEIDYLLTGANSPRNYFEKGKDFYTKMKPDKKYALIASGDLSHCLKEDGPYGYSPDGPKFDKYLINYLKKKDIKNILNLDEMFPEAGECGLRPFSFLLGLLEASGLNWQIKVLSYEGPFGVGYLVARFLFKD